MYRYGLIAGIIIVGIGVVVLLPATTAFAISPKEKLATCKFGADDQKLKGAARAAFIKKCMSNKNDPRGPKT